MSNEDPLEELYVNRVEINKERLSKALAGIVGIDREIGDSVILSGFSELSQSQKVFAFLLSRRVALELEQMGDTEIGLSASEIEKQTGVPQGTVRRYCSESRLVENDGEKGGYLIQEFAISEAIDKIESK